MLSDESRAKPVLALIDVSGSITRDMIESQLWFALKFAGPAGGWVGFFDTRLRSGLTELSAEGVASLIAGNFPGGGGTDILALKEAADLLGSERGPIRMLGLSDWCYEPPRTREQLGAREGDEVFLAGDCMEPGASKTDEMLGWLKKPGVCPEWLRMLDARTAWGFAAAQEALDIDKAMGPGAKAGARAL